MMDDDRTPLQRLDDAIQDFVASIDEEGTVAGWAVVYQTQYLNAEADPGLISPITWDAGYSIGPGASPFTVLGLIDHLRGVISDAYRIASDDDE